MIYSQKFWKIMGFQKNDKFPRRATGQLNPWELDPCTAEVRLNPSQNTPVSQQIYDIFGTTRPLTVG